MPSSTRWENTGKDIIKCRHPNCCGGGGGGGGGAPICITFHPSLNEESHNKVCQKYIDMLVSCHGSKCPFRTYASRWSKAMKQCTKNVVDDGFEVSDKGSDVLNDTYTTKFYVPPYFLSISDEFLFFEDCTVDGSITKDRIEQDAMNIRDMVKDGTINVDFSQLKLTVPDVVADYCHEIHPNADLGDVIDKYGKTMKTPYLLATFGWSICTELADEDNKNNSHAIVKCNMCLARSRMDLSSSRVDDEESSSRKRRRTDATFQLIDSHRMYCPFKSGFAYRPGVGSHRPGWKVVVSNLIKKTGTEGQSH